MKRDITIRFLVAVIVTFVVSFICYILINLYMIHVGNKVTDSFNVRDFNQYFSYENGKITVSEELVPKLEKRKIWVQVIDENGNEVYSKFKPNEVPAKYNLSDVIYYNDNPWAIIKGSTVLFKSFKDKNVKLCCVMGMREGEIAKVPIYYKPDTLGRDILFRGILMLMVIAIVVGYIFSFQFASPIAKMVDSIKLLANGEYSKIKASPDDLYKSVYKNINYLSDTLQANENERERLQKAREEWISNITHDLKTPLASIKGYSDMLLDSEYELSAEEKIKYVEIIRGKAYYMGELIEDLKLTYQLKNSIMPLNKKQENIVDILRDVIIDILNNPKYEDKEINFDCDEEEILYYCDIKLMKRAFNNLIYNAVVHNSQETIIDVGLKSENGIKIEIKDNGKGILKEDLDKLFERYYRGTNTGEAHKGSGLGMAISKQIIEAHGGSIKVESTLGVGTTSNILFKPYLKK